MLTINAKDIRSAAIQGSTFYPFYRSHIPAKKGLETGFGMSFDNFGELGEFLTALGAAAMYRECDSLSTRTNYLDPDTARQFAASMQIDPLGNGIVAYFPGWELSDD